MKSNSKKTCERHVIKWIGAPGTGKTSQLLALLKTETKLRPADRIAFCSFTRAAVEEAATRCGLSPLPRYFKTIHALCYQELGLSKHEVVTEARLRRFMSKLGYTHGPTQSEDNLLFMPDVHDPASLVMQEIFRAKAECRQWEIKNLPGTVDHLMAKHIANSYEAWKETEALIDFNDFLWSYLESGAPLPVDVAFIDEAQDLSELQWAVVEHMFKNAELVHIAGDSYQNLYEWSGSSRHGFDSHFQSRQDTKCITKILPHSYRLPIFVDALARKQQEWIGGIRDVSPTANMGRIALMGSDVLCAASVIADAREQRQSVLVLVRNNYQITMWIDLATTYAWRWVSTAKNGNNRAVESVVIWKRAQRGASINSEQARMMANFTREPLPLETGDDGFILTDQARKIPWWTALPLLPLMPYIRELELTGQLQEKPWLTFSTIHGAKGMEADVVLLMADLSYAAWDRMHRDAIPEHRTFYVATTRAREALYVIAPQTSLFYGSLVQTMIAWGTA